MDSNKIWHTSFWKFLNRPVSEESLKLEGSSQNDRSLTKERVMHRVQVSTEVFNLISNAIHGGVCHETNRQRLVC